MPILRHVVEFGHVSFCPPFRGAELAAEDEALGFDIRYFGDNTSVASDPFAELRTAAQATTHIKLATGSTNTVTKHPAVVATAIAAVQVASGGRAICGVGKGDSSMGAIGRGPQRHAEFVEKTTALRTYLRGESVRVGGSNSRLEWLDAFPEFEPVPLEIVCSGPKSIAAAAALADRITFSVGAADERVRWALGVLDEGLEAAGRTRADVQIGAYVPICVDPDRANAAERLRVRVTGAAHMSSFPGNDLSVQPEILRKVTTQLRTAYDYRHHNNDPDNPLGGLVDAEFADWFALGGPPQYLAERLAHLVELGLSHFMFAALPLDERERLATDVFPAVRETARGRDRETRVGRK